MTVVPLCLPTAAAPTEPNKPDEVERKELARELLEVAVGLHQAGVLDDSALLAHRLVALEMALDVKLLSLRPTAHGFRTPTEIAEYLGVTANRIGRTLSTLGLRQVAPGQAVRVVHKIGGRWVLGWAYGPHVVEKLAEHLQVRSAA